MYRKFLVIGYYSRITGINPAVLKGIKVFIGRILGTKVFVSHVVCLIIFDQPHIGMDRLVEYGFKSQRGTARSGKVFEDIIGSGIVVEMGDIAITCRHIPGRTEFLFRNDGRTVSDCLCQLFQFQITVFRFPKD